MQAEHGHQPARQESDYHYDFSKGYIYERKLYADVFGASELIHLARIRTSGNFRLSDRRTISDTNYAVLMRNSELLQMREESIHKD
jgi:hypothetical protein